MRAIRIPLFGFPDVALHAEEPAVKRHSQFHAAKAGDNLAARSLVAEFVNLESVESIRKLIDGRPIELVPIHALESAGVNQIPVALAKTLSRQLAVSINNSIVQSNSVGHTGASGFHRLANQALLMGK